MNKRLKKKKEKNIRKQLHEVLDLVLDINGLQESCESITHHHPTAFIEFSGHIGKLYVRLYTDGWSENKVSDISFESTVFQDFSYKLPVMIEELREFTKRGASDGLLY